MSTPSGAGSSRNSGLSWNDLACVVLKWPPESNLTHWRVLAARESAEYRHGQQLIHGQKNGPSVDVGCLAWPTLARVGELGHAALRQALTLADLSDLVAPVHARESPAVHRRCLPPPPLGPCNQQCRHQNLVVNLPPAPLQSVFFPLRVRCASVARPRDQTGLFEATAAPIKANRTRLFQTRLFLMTDPFRD
jgi:hypothetical protein